MIRNKDYLSRVARPIRNRAGDVIGWRFPQGGAYFAAMCDRPPIGRAWAGRLSTASGRGHRRCATDQARAERVRRAMLAFRLRTEQGLTLAEIAEQVGRSTSLVGRWLRGVPAVGPHTLDPLINDVNVLRSKVDRFAAKAREQQEAQA